jgi:hypothetical protein
MQGGSPSGGLERMRHRPGPSAHALRQPGAATRKKENREFEGRDDVQLPSYQRARGARLISHNSSNTA